MLHFHASEVSMLHFTMAVSWVTEEFGGMKENVGTKHKPFVKGSTIALLAHKLQHGVLFERVFSIYVKSIACCRIKPWKLGTTE